MMHIFTPCVKPANNKGNNDGNYSVKAVLCA